MIVTVVRFPETDESISLDEAAENFGGNAHTYLDTPGLLWKAYLRRDDGLQVGGVYWWTDRASAEARFNPGWRDGVTAKYGHAPTIEWFDAPVIADARNNVVLTEPPTV